jgi:hypothetical protein
VTPSYHEREEGVPCAFRAVMQVGVSRRSPLVDVRDMLRPSVAAGDYDTIALCDPSVEHGLTPLFVCMSDEDIAGAMLEALPGRNCRRASGLGAFHGATARGPDKAPRRGEKFARIPDRPGAWSET